MRFKPWSYFKRGDRQLTDSGEGQAVSAQTWETSKGTLAVNGRAVLVTIGRKTETMALADIESVVAKQLTLLQWLGWSGFLMWTGVGLLLAPFMLLVPALLVPFLLLVPTPWLVLLKNTAGRSVIVTVGPRLKALEIAAAILAAPALRRAPPEFKVQTATA